MYTYDEYLAYERDSALKHEFESGEILAMAGGSPRHSALASRISAALENTRPAACVAFQSDMRIRVLATGKATYPDASMVCGAIELDAADRSGTTITNPTLIVEVLSPSTEEVDRGSKWRDYQLIPSLQEYALGQPDPTHRDLPPPRFWKLGVRRRKRRRCGSRLGRRAGLVDFVRESSALKHSTVPASRGSC
jgi:Uma2 family endonuclease